eukprot:TRINITY_DN11953_c0_g1_i1.p1 TRINITY_DN11953_c0_g1~~TRINITY_DN11953_c0_g1_i1.p1  ORF type:complete len:406 (+),score=122.95 TRINITY_DN11953_c0_g1_i1:104-1321(+)
MPSDPDSAPPQISKTDEFLITTALDKSELKVKSSDGKTFYVSPVNQVTGGSVSVQGAWDVATKRAKEEAEILCEIDELESTMQQLTDQIETLREPILSEAMAVKALQRRVATDEVKLKRLETDNDNEKELRLIASQNLEAKVKELQAVINLEQAERKEQEDKLGKAAEEGQQLRREIEDEKRKVEWTKIEFRKAEKKQEDVLQEQKKLRQQARHSEELYDEIAATNNDLRAQQKTLKTACLELRSELLKVKKNIQNAQLTLSSKGDHSEIRREYGEKLKIWNDLELPAKLREDITFMERENTNLRRNLKIAEGEEKALASSAKMLIDSTHRAQVTEAMLRKENEQLELAIQTLANDAAALLAEEDTWSTDSEEPDEEVDYDSYQTHATPADPAYLNSLRQFMSAV